MYSKIVNPETGRKISVTSQLGKKILRKYLNGLTGGATQDAERVRCEEDLEAERRKYEILVANIEVLLHPHAEGRVLEEPDDPFSIHYRPTRDPADRTLAECKEELSAMQAKYASLVTTIDRALRTHAQSLPLPGGGGGAGGAGGAATKGTEPPAVISVVGDSTTFAHTISSPNVCIVVAANAGRPGGGLHADGKNSWKGVKVADVRPGHTTQEEDIVSNWLMTSLPEDLKKSVVAVTTKRLPATLEAAVKPCYDETFLVLHKKWGMTTPESDDKKTLTHGDFDEPITIHYDFNYVVKEAPVSMIKYTPGVFDKYYLDKPLKTVSLLFVAGPNANNQGAVNKQYGDAYWDSMKRTYDAEAHKSYDIFKEKLKSALVSLIQASVKNGDTHLIIPEISCGIYGGHWRDDIASQFADLVNAIIEDMSARNYSWNVLAKVYVMKFSKEKLSYERSDGVIEHLSREEHTILSDL